MKRSLCLFFSVCGGVAVAFPGRSFCAGENPAGCQESTYEKLHVGSGPDGPRMGDHGPYLKGARIYDYVRRSDLADLHRQNEALAFAVGQGGGAAVSSSLLFVVAGAIGFACPESGSSWTCSRWLDVSLVTGATLLGVGTAFMLAAIMYDPNPVSAIERANLIEQFNGELRRADEQKGCESPRGAAEGEAALRGWTIAFSF